ncbi:hypothetical protein N7463_006583 [Penicillium fimorum]|uniref:Uncharacterized protein n=1 Tax=Penicillium fimorum TaxID=1882269 RepID=A0A9W9XUQ0_9EURO|nr:hypothetical protein N7463_006583 [Penicillium fimorum]
MEPIPRDYAHLDAAASQLAHALREVGISHVFLGGYAAGLVGSWRITKEIDVVTERSPALSLKEVPQFTWSSDERCWEYQDSDTDVSISMLALDSGPWNFPSPRGTERFTVKPKDLPMRSIYAKIDILHPSVLILTKLKAWYAADVSRNPSAHMRTRAHFVDIMATLQWLSDEGEHMDACTGRPLWRGDSISVAWLK